MAKKLNIDLIGFTNAERFQEFEYVIKNRKEKGYLTPFGEKDINKNITPKLVWKEAKSIISLGLSYKHTLNVDKSSICEKQTRLIISKVAWGEDYHEVLMRKMKNLMSIIIKDNPNIKYRAFVDNAPLMDRAIAYRSGMGFYGKNGFIINPIYGSYIFLGHILVNVDLIDRQDIKKQSCDNCNKCINSCPTKALKEGLDFNANRCISYLTQKKGILKRWERKAIVNNIYGCDICQEVCPINKRALPSIHKEFQSSLDMSRPTIEKILSMDKEKFKITYGNTSAGWRGIKILKRNAIIALGNVKSEKNYNILVNYLNDDNWEIRLYVMFSLLEYEKKGINKVMYELNKEKEEFKNNYYLYKD